MDDLKITAIVFDYGGVIELSGAPDIHDSIAAYLQVPIEEFKTVYFQHNHLSNTGVCSWAEMLTRVARTFSDTDDTTRAVQTILLSHQTARHLNEELLSIVRDLKQSGFQTAVLSNYTSELRDRLKEQGIAELFDHIVVSGEVGHQKPSPEIFSHLFNELGVAANQVVFIDDTEQSLATAAEIGYHPIHFSDNDHLRTELIRLNIKL